ncbi:MAG: phosphoribosylformylglycinamidine synthase I [Planctomycetota bacterium]
MKPRALILRTAGTNCDEETAFAVEKAGGRADIVHVNIVAGRGGKGLADYGMLILPGGFSYGDDVASGKILANEIRTRLGEGLLEFLAAGKLVLGICNGFQVLVKMGLLPGFRPFEPPPATLIHNDSGKFEDRWVWLTSGSKRCVFLRGVERMYLPIAHGEGKFVLRDASLLGKLRANGQIAMRYTDGRGWRGGYPVNPNGSTDDIAGICDPTGRIFGLMPHPERHVLSTQHPRWTREGRKKEGDGLAVFRNAVKYF